MKFKSIVLTNFHRGGYSWEVQMQSPDQFSLAGGGGYSWLTSLRWLASFELKLIFFRNTFCHHRSPFAEHKSVIFYRGHHSN